MLCIVLVQIMSFFSSSHTLKLGTVTIVLYCDKENLNTTTYRQQIAKYQLSVNIVLSAQLWFTHHVIIFAVTAQQSAEEVLCKSKKIHKHWVRNIFPGRLNQSKFSTKTDTPLLISTAPGSQQNKKLSYPFIYI